VELIHRISDSFYSNPDGKDNRCLSEWLQCDFDGDESFSVVTKRFEPTTEIHDIKQYKNFVMKIPHMDMVYYFNDTHAGDCLLVSLILTIEGFIQYLSSTNVALEDNVLTEQEHSHSEDRNTNDKVINEFDNTEDIEVNTNNKDQGSLLADAKIAFSSYMRHVFIK